MDRQVSFKLKYLLIGLVVLFAFGSGLLVQNALNREELIPSDAKTVESPSPTAMPSVSPSADVLSESIIASGSGVLSSSGRTKVKVIRVVDGDTIQIEGGQTVRYIGIDTPETVKPATPVQCFGKEASNKNKELVEGKEIEMEKDVSETDRYGRLLRYIYMGDVMVNKYLVDEGFAYSSSYPPDVKYQEIFKEAQKAAQEAKKGLWQGCDVDPKKVVGSAGGVLGVQTSVAPTKNGSVVQAAANTPSVTVKATASPVAVTASSNSGDCKIKGNVTTEKIYHMPGCGSYEKTTINESQGERWFCSESEAVAAGWRKAKNC